MFSSDKPIATRDEDLLGRAQFAQNLGKAIVTELSQDNMVIGLFGKWGSGKTSIINIAVNEIKRLAIEIPEDSRPVIMHFAPWNFTSSDNLIGLFFTELKRTLLEKDEDNSFKSIGELLEKYSDLFDLLEYLPGGKYYAPFLKGSAKKAAEKILRKQPNQSLETTKEKLEEALYNQKHRIVVVIDDIDRLSNEQIRTIFQLVKQVAGLPNMTYLLSMDRDVVVNALESVQKCDGNEYLEKIVQVPFDIPQIDIERVETILFNKLDSLLQSSSNPAFDRNHWQRVYHYCVKPYIKSIRDVNRIYNSFQFKYSMLQGEVDFADLLGITVLEMYMPSLVRWIAQNKQLLCEGVSGYHLLINDKPEETTARLNESFKQYGIDSSIAFDSLAALFPMIGKLTGHSPYAMGDTTGNELRRFLRIAAPERFDLFFQLNTTLIAVDRQLIVRSLQEMSRAEYSDLIVKLNSDNKIGFYLEELQSQIKCVSQDRIPMIVEVLAEYAENLQGERQGKWIPISASRQAQICIEHLLSELSSSDIVVNIVKRIIADGSSSSVAGIISFLHRQELSHGRMGSDGRSFENCIISDAQLGDLEESFCVRMLRISADEDNLFSMHNLETIAFVWEYLDKENFNIHIKEKLKSTRRLLQYIVGLKGKWYSGSGEDNTGWSISDSRVQKYVDDINRAHESIGQYNKHRLLAEYDCEGLQKIATFVLNAGKIGDDADKVTISQAQNLVNNWQQENKRPQV